MYIITDADTGEEVFINDNHLVFIETNTTAKGYCTVHTTAKRFSVKADSIVEILNKSSERAAEIIKHAMTTWFE